MISVYLGRYHYKFTGKTYALLTNMETGNGYLVSGYELEACNKSNKNIWKVIQENSKWLDRD